MIEHLSYSSISTYMSCPELWRRKYIAKEPTFSTPALVFGSAIHQTLETYICQNEKTTDKLLVLWSGAWAQATEKETVVWGIDTPEQHYNEGIRILGDAKVQYEINTLMPKKNGDGFEIERKVELRVPSVPIPIIGYIDLITQDGVPGDFKTSSKSWSSDRAAGELQPLFYLAALNQAKVNVPGWRFRHYTIVKTKQPKFETFEVSHNPKELFFLFDVIKRVWLSIQANIFPLHPNSWQCGPEYCDFYRNCRGKYA